MFLDIELGAANGLELCRALLEVNYRPNVVYPILRFYPIPVAATYIALALESLLLLLPRRLESTRARRQL